MATAEDVRLADLIPIRMQKIKDLQAESNQLQADEVARREQWETSFYRGQGSLRALERELELAGEALQRIRSEVPADLVKAQQAAGAALRGHEEQVTRARQEAEAAQAVLDRRNLDAQKKLRGAIDGGSGTPVSKQEIEALTERIAERKGAHNTELAKRKDLEAAETKASGDVEAALKRIRDGALDLEKKAKLAKAGR